MAGKIIPLGEQRKRARRIRVTDPLQLPPPREKHIDRLLEPKFPYRDEVARDDDGSVSGGGEGLSFPVHFVPFFDSMNLDELKFALAQNDSPRALAFLADLGNPAMRGVHISSLAARNGIRVRDLMEIWRDHKLVAAQGEVLEVIPQVARETVEDARSTVACCNRCDGAGLIQVNRRGVQDWITCPTCKGKGEVRRPGDKAAREFAFKAAGLVKAEGIQVNINQTIGSDSVLEELERAGPQTVDARVLDRDS